MMQAYLALDPGKTTGYVLATEHLGILAVGEASSFEELLPVLEAATIVITESFTLQPWKAQAQSFSKMYSSELIGAVKYWCTEHKTEYVEQLPAKRIVATPALLKATPLWAATKGLKHARDAARHLLTYLLINNKAQIVREFVKNY